MSKRKIVQKNKDDDLNITDNDDISDDEVNNDNIKNTKKQPSSKSKGYNISAIIIMLLFLLPGVIGAFLYIYDMYYPEAAALRKVRERVVRCYEVANPSKISEVDKFIDKYKGRSHVLFAQLRTKYQKYPECN